MSTTIEDLSIKRCLGLLILSTALVLIPSIITSKRVTVSVPNPSIALGRLEPTAEATSLEDMLVDKPKVEPEPVIAPVAVIEPVPEPVVPEPPVTPKPTQKPVTKPPVAPQTYNEPIGDHVALMQAAGISPSDYQYVEFIVMKESSWNHTADNPTSSAYGLCQALPGKKMATAGADWETNPVTQLKWCNSYAHSRYRSWATAYNSWKEKNWW